MKIKSGEHEFEIDIPIENIGSITVRTSIDQFGARQASIDIETAVPPDKPRVEHEEQ